MEFDRRGARIARRMQVGAADVTDKKRVAREHEPGLFRSPALIRHDVGVVRGRMARRRHRSYERVPELDHVVVGQCRVHELDLGPRR